MNVIRTTASLLFMIITLDCVFLSSSSAISDNSLRDLYSNLLQREYTGPISFPDHQMERKAQRSPSLRLRFGRRSDPSFPIFGNRFSKYIEEINKKPIRSPSLRLRYGKRDPSFTNQDYTSNEIDMNREIRAPAGVLRFGRNDPFMQQQQTQSIEQSDEFQLEPEKRKSLRLRFGRSYNPLNAHSNEESDDFQLEPAQKRQALRLRYGRSGYIPANTQYFEQNDDYQMDAEKRQPLRLRFGRSNIPANAQISKSTDQLPDATFSRVDSETSGIVSPDASSAIASSASEGESVSTLGF